jgi:hypothetical protein
MRSRYATAFALAAVMLGTGAAIVVASGDDVKSKVKITSATPTSFAGEVSSKNDKCLKKREVTLTFTNGTGLPEPVGSATTKADGSWVMPGNYSAGLYLALVAARPVHHVLCGEAHSKVKNY